MDKPDVRVFAYANDINLVVTNECFSVISEILSLYEKNSNATIHMFKSNGLWCGACKNRHGNIVFRNKLE